jgi:hypothetical protein
MKRWCQSLGVVVACAVAVCFGVRGEVPSARAEPSDPPEREVHADAGRLVQSVLDTTHAFLAEDPVAARAALDAVKAATPPLHPDDDEPSYGSEMVNLDRAFHMTIDLAREHVTDGRMTKGFDQFVWVQRACVKCHKMAREQGRVVRLQPDEAQP